MSKMASKKYLYRGHVFEVGNSEGPPRIYRTYWVGNDGEARCVYVKGLPPRITRVNAQRDLDKWAAE